MAQHDIHIEITPSGEVRVTMKGVKGKDCFAYRDALAKIVGKLKTEQRTNGYYEPPTKAKIDVEQKQGK